MYEKQNGHLKKSGWNLILFSYKSFCNRSFLFFWFIFGLLLFGSVSILFDFIYGNFYSVKRLDDRVLYTLVSILSTVFYFILCAGVRVSLFVFSMKFIVDFDLAGQLILSYRTYVTKQRAICLKINH